MVNSMGDWTPGLLFFVLLSGTSQAGVTAMREGITLACNDCKNRNYRTTKNKKNNPERLEIRKYCKFCRAETVHRETR